MNSQSGTGSGTDQVLWIKGRGANTKLQDVTARDRGAIARLVLDPEQEQFAGSVDAIFDELQASKHPEFEHPFAIVADTEKIGFFILRERPAVPIWAPHDVITLHSFRIGRPYQGAGFGRAGVALAVSWIRQNRPDARQLMLAVNIRNAPARALYIKCGFVDTGATFRGPIGEQHILALDITPGDT